MAENIKRGFSLLVTGRFYKHLCKSVQSNLLKVFINHSKTFFSSSALRCIVSKSTLHKISHPIMKGIHYCQEAIELMYINEFSNPLNRALLWVSKTKLCFWSPQIYPNARRYAAHQRVAGLEGLNVLPVLSRLLLMILNMKGKYIMLQLILWRLTVCH